MPGPRVGPLGTARERLGSVSARDTVKTETFCILQVRNYSWGGRWASQQTRVAAQATHDVCRQRACAAARVGCSRLLRWADERALRRPVVDASLGSCGAGLLDLDWKTADDDADVQKPARLHHTLF